MRNPERSALLKVSGLLGSTVVAMGLGLLQCLRAEEPDNRIQPAFRSLQTKAPFTGAGPAASVSLARRARPGQSFEQWRDAFRQQALAGGIDAQTFDRAFAGVEPDPAVVEADRSQPEFTRPVWKYLEGALDPLRAFARARRAWRSTRASSAKSTRAMRWMRMRWWRSGAWRATTVRTWATRT